MANSQQVTAFKWQDASEVVAGYLISGELSGNSVNPVNLYPPYGEIVSHLREGKDRDELLEVIGLEAHNAAEQARERVSGKIPPIKWIQILDRCALNAQASADLKKMAKDLEEGKPVDIGVGLTVLSRLELGQPRLVPMTSIEATKEDKLMVRTGYEPWDKHIGGIPDSGLTIIASTPGVGKTSLALKLAKCKVRLEKDTKVAIFTLEMTMSQLAMRLLQIDRSLTKEQKSRILMGDTIFGISELYAVASRAAAQDKLGMIVIDFADLLVEGEQSESIMGVIYRTLSILAKRTGVPVVLISQLNRNTYAGGEPRINHIRYSGVAEQMAGLIVLVYNPTAILADYSGESKLEKIPGKGYLIIGKSRFGTAEGQLGAIQLDWDGGVGWGDKNSVFIPYD